MQVFRLMLVAGILAGSSLTLLAQPPGFTPLRRPNRPTVTPYLGLIGGNNGVGFNYYEIYRPQRRFQKAYENLNSDLGRLRTNVRQYEHSQAEEYEQFQLGPTGHPTMFNSTRGYFPGLR